MNILAFVELEVLSWGYFLITSQCLKMARKSCILISNVRDMFKIGAEQ